MIEIIITVVICIIALFLMAYVLFMSGLGTRAELLLHEKEFIDNLLEENKKLHDRICREYMKNLPIKN